MGSNSGSQSCITFLLLLNSQNVDNDGGSTWWPHCYIKHVVRVRTWRAALHPYLAAWLPGSFLSSGTWETRWTQINFLEFICPLLLLLTTLCSYVTNRNIITLENPLDCKKIQPVHPEGDQSWVFIGRTDAETETPILWPPHAKSWLIGKDPDAGRDWGQEEKGTTEDEIATWYHQHYGREFE